MEIINRYGSGLILTPEIIDYNGTGYGTHHTQSSTNKLYFFTGAYDNATAFDVSNETELMASFGSQYIGSVEGFGLDFIYDSDNKKRIIKQNPVDAMRFLDSTYMFTAQDMTPSYELTGAYTSAVLEIYGKKAIENYFINGTLLTASQTTENNGFLQSHDKTFVDLFTNGTSVDGGIVDLETEQIWGYRVTGAGEKGYYSINMQEAWDMGIREIEFVVTAGTYGAIFVGSLNGADYLNTAHRYYGSNNARFRFNLVEKTIKFIDGTIDGSANPQNADFSNRKLSDIVIGACSIQAGSGWQQWSVTTKTYTDDVVYDEVSFTGDISITRDTVEPFESGMVIPYISGVPETKPLSWCALRIGSSGADEYFIYTDMIGTFDTPSLINLDSTDTVAGKENIVTSIKVDVRDKSEGEV